MVVRRLLSKMTTMTSPTTPTPNAIAYSTNLCMVVHSRNVVLFDCVLLDRKKKKRRERGLLAASAYLVVAHVCSYADQREDGKHEDVPEDGSCESPLCSEVVAEREAVSCDVVCIAVCCDTAARLETLQQDHDDHEADDADTETNCIIQELYHSFLVHSFLLFHCVHLHQS